MRPWCISLRIELFMNEILKNHQNFYLTITYYRYLALADVTSHSPARVSTGSEIRKQSEASHNGHLCPLYTCVRCEILHFGCNQFLEVVDRLFKVKINSNIVTLFDWNQVTRHRQSRFGGEVITKWYPSQGNSRKKSNYFVTFKWSHGVLKVKMNSMLHIYILPLFVWYRVETSDEPFWRRSNHKVVPFRDIQGKKSKYFTNFYQSLAYSWSKQTFCTSTMLPYLNGITYRYISAKSFLEDKWT